MQPRFTPQIETIHRKDGSTLWRVSVGGTPLWAVERQGTPSASDREFISSERVGAVVEAQRVSDILGSFERTIASCDEPYEVLVSKLRAHADRLPALSPNPSLGARQCLLAGLGALLTAWLVEHA